MLVKDGLASGGGPNAPNGADVIHDLLRCVVHRTEIQLVRSNRHKSGFAEAKAEKIEHLIHGNHPTADSRDKASTQAFTMRSGWLTKKTLVLSINIYNCPKISENTYDIIRPMSCFKNLYEYHNQGFPWRTACIYTDRWIILYWEKNIIPQEVYGLLMVGGGSRLSAKIITPQRPAKFR